MMRNPRRTISREKARKDVETKMHKFNRLFHGEKWIALVAAMILMLAVFCLPLQAASPYRGQDDNGIVGDIGNGVRRFGRDISDALDPNDNGTADGLLPDGSINDGMDQDGSQNDPDHDGIPEMTADTDQDTLPGTSDGTDSNGTTGTSGGTDTNPTTPGTSAPTTTNNTQNGNDTSGTDNSGFRWTGLIIALVIAAAVVLIIILVMPKKKS